MPAQKSASYTVEESKAAKQHGSHASFSCMTFLMTASFTLRHFHDSNFSKILVDSYGKK
jgi:hypothetical protein